MDDLKAQGDAEIERRRHVARRREALRQADATNRLEGIFRDPATDAIFEAHIRGEIDSRELGARLKAMPHPV